MTRIYLNRLGYVLLVSLIIIGILATLTGIAFNVEQLAQAGEYVMGIGTGIPLVSILDTRILKEQSSVLVVSNEENKQ